MSDEAVGKMTGDGELEADGVQQQAEADQVEQGDAETNSDGSDVQDDIENKAEGLKGSSADQHIGDAMDDVNLEPPGS